MTRQTVFTNKAPEAIGPYSQAIKIGSLVFTSGQIPLDPVTGKLISDDIADQTSQVLKNLEEVLKAAGSSLRKVIKTTIFIQNMEEFGLVNEVYGRFFSENPPARSTVEVSRLPKDVKIEIEAIAQI